MHVAHRSVEKGTGFLIVQAAVILNLTIAATCFSFSVTLLCRSTVCSHSYPPKYVYPFHPTLSTPPFPAMVSALLLNPSKNRLFLHCTNVVSLLQPKRSTGSPLHWLTSLSLNHSTGWAKCVSGCD